VTAAHILRFLACLDQSRLVQLHGHVSPGSGVGLVRWGLLVLRVEYESLVV
jgi:hypothetical protein